MIIGKQRFGLFAVFQLFMKAKLLKKIKSYRWLHLFYIFYSNRIPSENCYNLPNE